MSVYGFWRDVRFFLQGAHSIGQVGLLGKVASLGLSLSSGFAESAHAKHVDIFD